MTIYVVSDRKHVRIAIYNLLGISPGDDGVFVIKKFSPADVQRARPGEDTFVGNMPLEYAARLQEKGVEVLFFETTSPDCDGYAPSADIVLDAVDKTGRLCQYEICRDESDTVPDGEVLVHVSEPDRRAAVFSYLQEHGIAHRPGFYAKSGTMNRAVKASGKAVVGCGALPHHAAVYGPENPFYLLELDFSGKLVRYHVRFVRETHAPRGKRAFA